MISIVEGIESVRIGTMSARRVPSGERPDAVDAPDIDVAGLERALRDGTRGEVRFTDGDRALYSTDASNYRQIPIGVVLPKDADDVVATIEAARRFGAPILSRGGGTDLAGSTTNAAIVLDTSKYMNHIRSIDWDAKTAVVEPGTVLDDLRKLAEERHLTYGPDPATHDRCTLGGMIGNNSCGTHAQYAGKVEENIEALEIVTYDGLRMRVGPTSDADLERIIARGGRRGEIYAQLRDLRDRYADAIRAGFPKLMRRVSGYPLQELLPEHGFNVARALVGTESTCVTILEATCRLVESPQYRTLAVLGFPDIATAADAVPFVNEHRPIAVEGIEHTLFDFMHDKRVSATGRAMLPPGGGWLLVEFGADSKDDADARAQALVDAFAQRGQAEPSHKLFTDSKEQKKLWKIRESALGASSKIPHEPDLYPGWEDSAVPPEALGAYMRELQALLEEFHYKASLYGHFGTGCIHCRIEFDLFTADGIELWKRFLVEAARLVTKHGGSLSGEHGDGQARGWLLPIMFGDELTRAFGEFKAIWDPANRMNPGKVVHPYAVDVNLRWGKHYSPWEPQTHFQFSNDDGSFARAANRCVGAGVCRKHDSGTMCPSFMATREEKYSTRGRARLLFEMLEGSPLRDGWRDESVKEALDLCLSCKACRQECPVSVDMTTYKAEFLSHYYEGRRRPNVACAFGLMPWLAHVASSVPPVANFFAQAPGFRDALKFVTGIAPRRTVPMFANESFVRWWKARAPKGTENPPVILWPDTWNNYFLPSTLKAAVEVLEAAGFHVIVPQTTLCCGRPLYDYGMLDLAKKLLREIIETLRPHIQAGTCVVGLEPSCVSVFRDEMRELLHHDRDAQKLAAQTLLLSEFLAQKAPDFKLPRLEGSALVQGHCHQKARANFDDEVALLERLGLTVDVLDSGCCGMAGGYGYEAGEKYGISLTLGERVLLPAVRKAADSTLVLANGFSCREQIAQETEREGLHLAHVLKMALDGEPVGRLPERRYYADTAREARKVVTAGFGFLATVALVASAAALARNARG